MLICFATVLLISVASRKLHVSSDSCLVHLSLPFTTTLLHGSRNTAASACLQIEAVALEKNWGRIRVRKLKGQRCTYCSGLLKHWKNPISVLWSQRGKIQLFPWRNNLNYTRRYQKYHFGARQSILVWVLWLQFLYCEINCMNL